jgi:hypothetical protein
VDAGGCGETDGFDIGAGIAMSINAKEKLMPIIYEQIHETL